MKENEEQIIKDPTVPEIEGGLEETAGSEELATHLINDEDSEAAPDTSESQDADDGEADEEGADEDGVDEDDVDEDDDEQKTSYAEVLSLIGKYERENLRAQQRAQWSSIGFACMAIIVMLVILYMNGQKAKSQDMFMSPNSNSTSVTSSPADSGIPGDVSSSEASSVPTIAPTEDTNLEEKEFTLPNGESIQLPSLKGGEITQDANSDTATVTLGNLRLVYEFSPLTETPPEDLLTDFADGRVREIIMTEGTSDMIASPLYNNNQTFIRTLSYLRDSKTVCEEVISVLRISDEYYGTVQFISQYDNVTTEERTAEQQQEMVKMQAILVALFGIS